jgi:glutathione synthase
MKFAFITDALESLKIQKDSTYAMMREAAARGHEVHALRQEGLVWSAGNVTGNIQQLHLVEDIGNWYRADAPQMAPLTAFDAVLMRKDPPFDMEYIYSTYLLELAQIQGARIFNDPGAIRDHNEKMSIAYFPQFAPPTLVTRRIELIHEFLVAHSDIILKPLDGMGGISVFRLQRNDLNLNVIIETVTQYGQRTVMAQRFVPEIADGDKRILLIGGKPVPYALARIPRPGETRGNLATGATGIARALTSRDREIAETIGPRLAAQGLLLIGIDVIGDWLTEINVTSPTCFQEITKQTGFNVAGMMLDTLEKALQAPHIKS